ncbi:MAG: PH domain-containing protein [Acidimicrobiales bacterium]
MTETRRHIVPARATRKWRPDDIVKSYLLETEEAQLTESRSLTAWLLDQWWVFVLGIMAMAVASVYATSWLRLICFFVIVFVVGWLLVQGAQAYYIRYVITDLRVLRVSGVLHRKAEFIPWRKVTDVTRTESLLQWMLRTATIKIESANDSSPFQTMSDVQDPANFYAVLVDMVDRFQGRVNLDVDPRSIAPTADDEGPRTGPSPNARRDEPDDKDEQVPPPYQGQRLPWDSPWSGSSTSVLPVVPPDPDNGIDDADSDRSEPDPTLRSTPSVVNPFADRPRQPLEPRNGADEGGRRGRD